MFLYISFKNELSRLLYIFLEVGFMPKEKIAKLGELISCQPYKDATIGVLEVSELFLPGHVCVALHKKVEPNLSFANLEAIAICLLLVDYLIKAYSVLLTQLVEQSLGRFRFAFVPLLYEGLELSELTFEAFKCLVFIIHIILHFSVFAFCSRRGEHRPWHIRHTALTLCRGAAATEKAITFGGCCLRFGDALFIGLALQ